MRSAAAKGLRLAFDLAVDKQGLATTVCHNLICSAATGGLITTGLVGNGGPNSDPLAKFDADPGQVAAQAVRPDRRADQEPHLLVQRGQPQRERRRVPAERVADQPRRATSTSTRSRMRRSSSATGSRASTRCRVTAGSSTTTTRRTGTTTSGARIPTAEGANTSGFDDPTYDSILKQADAEPLTTALPLYNQLAQILQNDVVYIPLYYSVGQLPDPAVREGSRFEHRLRPLLERDQDPLSLERTRPEPN